VVNGKFRGIMGCDRGWSFRLGSAEMQVVDDRHPACMDIWGIQQKKWENLAKLAAPL